ncbi:MAG: LysM domain [Clostridiales bacterium]|nr:LysM domain [Clostridiales bacterium]
MEELKKQKKLHNQVVEELLRQEQEQQQVSRRLQQRQRTKSTPNINRSNMITIILAGLVVVLMFYQFYSNRKYQKVIDTIAQQDITVNGGQGETLAGMEKRLTTVENKVDEILSQFQFNIEPVDVGESTGQDTSAVTTDGQPKYKKYIVQKGDTLWSISQKFYGTGQKSEELMEINGFTNPNDIKAGTTILVPANR